MRGTRADTHPGSQGEVVRRRLVAALDRWDGAPLTLVSAPAGYGKSTLVTSWLTLAERDITVVRTVLDGPDLPVQEVWSGLLAALRLRGVDVAPVAATRSSDDLGRAVSSALARSLSGRETPVVWVLDCAEWSLPPELADGLRRVLDSTGDGLRVVLLTRTDPPLPLHRYRLSGAVTEIRAQDLAFTVTESAQLVQQAGLDLAPEDVATLHERTGGWPAGLAFAVLSLVGRDDSAGGVREFRGDTGNVSDYLMTEVLAKQPDGIRDFLLRTCLVDRLEPGLVQALTGEFCDERALEFLTHASSFVEPVAGSPGSYRYQSLFREFLRSQLAFESPAQLPELHRAAARWFADQDRPTAAIHHAVCAGAWDEAAHYAVEGLLVTGLLTGRCGATPAAELALLPAGVPGAEAAVTRAALALAALDDVRATTELDAACVVLERDESARTPACLVAVAVLDAVAVSLGPDPDRGLDAVLAAERVLAETPDQVAGHAEPRAVLAGCKVRVLLRRGDLPAARTALADGLVAAETAHLDGVATELHGMHALVEAMSGNLRHALDAACRLGLPAASDDGTTASAAAALALAWVRTEQYDLPAAQGLVGLVEEAAPTYDTKAFGAVLALVRARLLADQGDVELARATLRAARRTASAEPAPDDSWLDRCLVVAQASTLLDEGRPEDAAALVRAVDTGGDLATTLVLRRALHESGDLADAGPDPASAAVRAAPVSVQVDAWLLRTAWLLRRGEDAAAEKALEHALRAAAPENLRRPLLEAADDVRKLLDHSGLAARNRWLHQRGGGDQPGHDADRAHLAVAAADVSAAAVVNPLTPKEQEVLGCLARLLTTEEIATEMFVSVNTVRSHVRSIIRKLDVTRRNEAVRRAWELGLLPPRDVA